MCLASQCQEGDWMGRGCSVLPPRLRTQKIHLGGCTWHRG